MVPRDGETMTEPKPILEAARALVGQGVVHTLEIPQERGQASVLATLVVAIDPPSGWDGVSLSMVTLSTGQQYHSTATVADLTAELNAILNIRLLTSSERDEPEEAEPETLRRRCLS
jgi:hypothetical protein